MRWLGRQGLAVTGVGALVHGKGYHIRHSSRMACDIPLRDPSSSWEEDICGSQGLETVEADESCAIVSML